MTDSTLAAILGKLPSDDKERMEFAAEVARIIHDGAIPQHMDVEKTERVDTLDSVMQHYALQYETPGDEPGDEPDYEDLPEEEDETPEPENDTEARLVATLEANLHSEGL